MTRSFRGACHRATAASLRQRPILFDTLAGAVSHMSACPGRRQRGWAYTGGDCTVAVGGNRGVFVETVRADINRLFEALIAPGNPVARGQERE